VEWRRALCSSRAHGILCPEPAGELYKDTNGFTTGLVQDLSEITLTYEKILFSTLILRAEYRYDASTAGRSTAVKETGRAKTRAELRSPAS